MSALWPTLVFFDPGPPGPLSLIDIKGWHHMTPTRHPVSICCIPLPSLFEPVILIPVVTSGILILQAPVRQPDLSCIYQNKQRGNRGRHLYTNYIETRLLSILQSRLIIDAKSKIK
jgi:hypothetical protein